MYLYLGGSTVVNGKDIIGIFDLDNATVSKKTRDYHNFAEKQGRVTYTSYDLPKSFLICKQNKNSFRKNNRKENDRVYISAISASTLKKRAANIENI